MKTLLLLSLILFSTTTFAVMEISGQFAYDKDVYGNTNQNKHTSRTYGGSLAIYLFNYTAIEFNYSETEEITTENNVIPISGTGYSVSSLQNKTVYKHYGAGIRQAFSGRKSRLRPSISLGYAKQKIVDTSNYTFRNDSTGTLSYSSEEPSTTLYDSAFVSFNISLRITDGLSIKGMVRSVMPRLEFSKASENMKYMVGFGWMF